MLLSLHLIVSATSVMFYVSYLPFTKRLVPEKYVKLVQDMYTGCRTKVRTVAGESSKFNVEVGLHQGSALSTYLFLILMDVLTERVRKEAPESMLFADDIVLC